MKTLRLILNIILGFGCMAVFNESDTFVPNIIGLICIALLVAINPTGDSWLECENDK